MENSKGYLVKGFLSHQFTKLDKTLEEIVSLLDKANELNGESDIFDQETLTRSIQRVKDSKSKMKKVKNRLEL